MPGEIGQMHLIQWLANMLKIKEIRVKDRSNPWMTNEILAFIYKRDYTHRMAWPH